MKKFSFTIGLSLLIFFVNAQDTTKNKLRDTLMLENIEVTSTRAADKAPFTKTNLSKQQIEKVNLGQDLPFILNQTPSVVVNSDAGNGVGYTGIHIRGTDASRINVTLNGVPYNDAESQGTFFVDLPDVASSVNSIQIQRGVGTSSNGAGAFGATINLSTNEVNKAKYAEFNNSYGSFNTWKNTIKLGSGLLGNHFLIDARVSRISSDGYIDRATSNLQSFYVSAAYINNNSSLRFNILSGKEKTYQAWYGVPQSFLDSDRTYNPAGTEKPGAPYANETDNYTQTHYQLFFNHKFNSLISFNVAAFLSRGKGYYEEYRAAQAFSDYYLPDIINGTDTITSADLIRRLWLDNYFYGSIFSLQYHKNKTQFTFGGGLAEYDGKHYNIVTWAQQGFPKDYKYFNAPAKKNDFNFYAKLMQSFGKGFTGFVDIQERLVKYNINGFESHPTMNIEKKYYFFNPKTGISFNKNNYEAYLSFSVAAHEPNRDDFEAGINQIPKPEILYDAELGIERKNKIFNYGATFYYMYYHNQLVNTGKINDVGAYTRTNAPDSYRAGVELQADATLAKWINFSGNISFSENKIKNFTEYIDDYDGGPQKQNIYHNTDISFSPDIVAYAGIDFIPLKNSEINFQSKYVGRQFLDNTSHLSRSIDPYFVENVKFSYTLSKKFFKEVNFIFQVNNLFNKKYESNGYTYNYISGGSLNVENYYFPMAGINFMAGVNIKL
ncbi:MAG: TonB-dependent receptor plug domain-containing protein [Bacteroidota bacterium]|nr:TonB-dependent receptor plug domain-containing protein [Bacteroidota bacterium]